MSIFSKVIDAVGSVFPPANLVKGIVGLVAQSGGDASKVGPEIQALIIQRDSERDAHSAKTMQVELETRARSIEAEMQQGDTFTKRARPMLVYAGLVMFFLEFGLRTYLTVRGLSLPEGTLVPTPFVAGWTVAVSVWSVGRTVEKVQARKQPTAAGAGGTLLKALMG